MQDEVFPNCPPLGREFGIVEQGIYAFPAQVRIAQPANLEVLMALARQRANDPTILDELGPFFWGAAISNNRLDSYFTMMARSSLDNFARGAADGVSFQNSHRWDELPLGASLTGRVEELESGVVQVVSDFYTLAGLRLGSTGTDQFIRGVRSGVVKDVSIGFSGGTRTCNLCHQNYMGCPHYAGRIYEIEENGVIRQVRSTVTVENATLHEVSAVYDGATPGAVILKARAAAADGRLRQKEAEELERMYRVSIPVTRQFDVPGPTPGKVERMNEQQFGRLKDALVKASVVPAAEREALDEEGALAAADKLTLRVKELEPQAADGRQYRADLVNEALAEGVRAQGKDFDKPTYEGVLTNAPIAVIKRMRDDWKSVGDQRLPGGRTSTDSGDDGQTINSVSLVPDSAYGG